MDRFLYIGTANKRLYQSFGVPETRLYSAPYAVDNDRFEQQAGAIRARRRELRRQWEIADDAFCVLFCGKLIAKKRPMDLVGAIRMLKADGRLPNAQLLFAGSGELDELLRQVCDVVYDFEHPILARRNSPAAHSAGSSERPPASFVGFLNQTEISRAYVAANCLVLPSDHGETWGLVVNEALASGLPCLVSDGCGCAEDLAGEEFSFPTGDVRMLADKLEQLYYQKIQRHSKRLPSIDDSVATIWQTYSGYMSK